MENVDIYIFDLEKKVYAKFCQNKTTVCWKVNKTESSEVLLEKGAPLPS